MLARKWFVINICRECQKEFLINTQCTRVHEFDLSSMFLLLSVRASLRRRRRDGMQLEQLGLSVIYIYLSMLQPTFNNFSECQLSFFTSVRLPFFLRHFKNKKGIFKNLINTQWWSGGGRSLLSALWKFKAGQRSGKWWGRTDRRRLVTS